MKRCAICGLKHHEPERSNPDMMHKEAGLITMESTPDELRAAMTSDEALSIRNEEDQLWENLCEAKQLRETVEKLVALVKEVIDDQRQYGNHLDAQEYNEQLTRILEEA